MNILLFNNHLQTLCLSGIFDRVSSVFLTSNLFKITDPKATISNHSQSTQIIIIQLITCILNSYTHNWSIHSYLFIHCFMFIYIYIYTGTNVKSRYYKLYTCHTWWTKQHISKIFNLLEAHAAQSAKVLLRLVLNLRVTKRDALSETLSGV